LFIKGRYEGFGVPNPMKALNHATYSYLPFLSKALCLINKNKFTFLEKLSLMRMILVFFSRAYGKSEQKYAKTSLINRILYWSISRLPTLIHPIQNCRRLATYPWRHIKI
jgi:hypothetical protein